MKKTVVTLFVALTALAIVADVRSVLSLNGTWDYIVDQQDVGEECQFPQDRSLGVKELVQQDFDAAPKMRIPSDWNTADQKLDLYEGSVWFRRTFDFETKEGERALLKFGAANYRTDVWLDGEKLGFHEGGFTPFSFDVTDVLKKGCAHKLIVRVNNARTKEHVPALSFDWWNYGGLTRDVSLVRVPAVHVADATLQLSKDGDRLVGFVRANERKLGLVARVTVAELGIAAEAKTDADGLATFSIAAAPRCWSPENPKLYDVRFSLGGDSFSDRIGFRTIATRGREILLNGTPVFLKGACLHDERIGASGRVTCEADAARAIKLAKEMGCNFLRLAHYPHNEATVRLADREGVMLWCETPVYWSIDWESPEAFAAARQQVSEMVIRDRNRASVIIWSVANETPHSPARDRFLTGLVSRVRELDATRLVTLAMDLRERDGYRCTIRDNLEPLVDIVSFNQYVGWYLFSSEEADKVEWIVPYEKPVVISEFGGGAVFGRHGDRSERWTEEFQAELYRSNLKMLGKIPGLSGLAPWILADFRSPRRPCHGIQDYYNRKGLASEKGEKKQAFGVMRDFYVKPYGLAPEAAVDWELTFADEFETPTVDTNKWYAGYRNGQFEYYRRVGAKHPGAYTSPECCYEISNGTLKLRMDERCPTRPHVGSSAVSCFMTSDHRYGKDRTEATVMKKFGQKYGWFEMRCKIAKGPGLESAFWLHQVDPLHQEFTPEGRPNKAEGALEFDIFEAWGTPTNQVRAQMNVHFTDSGHYAIAEPDPDNDFHVFALEWEEGLAKFYYDGKVVKTYRGPTPQREMFVLMALFHYRCLPDHVATELTYPKDFEVDYVRVFRRKAGVLCPDKKEVGK